MSTPPAPTPVLPPWQRCGHGADPTIDSIGCPGTLVPGHTACLAHVNDTDRDAYLTGLTPGADIDHCGTPFTEPLLEALRQALDDPITGRPHFGTALFIGAQFSGLAWFNGAQFSGKARFDKAQFQGDAAFGEAQFAGNADFERAQFSGDVDFGKAQFSGDAAFGGAQFSGNAWFNEAQLSADAGFGGAMFSREARFTEAQFHGTAWFVAARFSGNAWFNDTQFSGDAWFDKVRFSGNAWFNKARLSGEAQFGEVQFSGDAWFGSARFSGNAAWFNRALFSGDAQFSEARFSGNAWFDRAQFSADAGIREVQFAGDAGFCGARFAATPWFGPVVCAREVDLSGAVFEVPVTLEIAAYEVRCERTRWESTTTLRLRYATIDLSHAVLSFPAAVTAHPAPFFTTATGTAVEESLLAGSQNEVRVASVRGVDAAHLVLTDTDLRDCLFTGAFHLDQLRLEGRCTFASTPVGLHRRHLIWPYRWTRRRTLAEEHHWRALTIGQPALIPGQTPSPRNWRNGPHHPDPDLTPDPEDVVALYRHLRKAFEDGKNEPGAADFYYGEMEMRRHDHKDTSPGERALLSGYWLLSGYGLRASRALAWLLAAVAATVVLMMGLGLPDSSPQQVATGTVPADGGRVTLLVDKQDPRLTLPVGSRFTGERFDKAVQVVMNSVVFRASGQDLTTWGTYTEMVSRFTEPVLLALAVLAMRSRIKR